MSYSYTNTESSSFTVTHAKHLASKVATDLKRIQRFYGSPTDLRIEQFEKELIEYLKNGYLNEVTYGFQKDGKWISPTLKYTAKDLQSLNSANDDPGRIPTGVNIEGAHFTSYLVHNMAYVNASESERNSFLSNLPFQRVGAPEPEVNGYLSTDKTYSSGGKSLERSIVKNY